MRGGCTCNTSVPPQPCDPHLPLLYNLILIVSNKLARRRKRRRRRHRGASDTLLCQPFQAHLPAVSLPRHLPRTSPPPKPSHSFLLPTSHVDDGPSLSIGTRVAGAEWHGPGRPLWAVENCGGRQRRLIELDLRSSHQSRRQVQTPDGTGAKGGLLPRLPRRFFPQEGDGDRKPGRRCRHARWLWPLAGKPVEGELGRRGARIHGGAR